MKKHFLILLSLFAGVIPAFSQIMPDNSVQVVAYWNLGDKYDYQIENTKYRIERGDTTIIEMSAKLLEFEVVGADEEKGYRVKVTTLDSQYSNPTQAAISEKWTEYFGEDVQYFETNPLGYFLRVLPVEGLEKKTKALAKDITDVLIKNNPGVDRAPVQAVISQLLSPEAIQASTEAELRPLFFYHGARLDFDREYSFIEEVPSLWGNGHIKMNASFWADKEYTDEVSVVLHMQGKADDEQLKPLLISLLSSAVNAISPNERLNDEVAPAIQEAVDNAKLSMDDYQFEEVHLDSGWPLTWVLNRSMKFEIGDKEREEVLVKTIEMLPEEE